MSEKKILPKDLSTQDILKCLAVFLMVIDHLGHHFFPDEMWFRVLGRLCVPIWFFLIGFARSSDKPLHLWAAAALLQLSGLISGQFLLPLNILFAILIMRHMRAGFVRSALHSPESMRGVFFILLLLTLPTAIIFEYGSIAMLFVIIGYFTRNRQDALKTIPHIYLVLFTAVSFFMFYITQGISLPALSGLQAVAMGLGFVFVAILLWNFEVGTFPNLTRKLPKFIVVLLQLMGRKTLEIYVLHVIAFRALCMWLYPETYGFMEWHILPASMLDALF